MKCSKCEGNHHTLLHIHSQNSQRTSKNVESKETSACASAPMGAGEGECTMAIIPLRVRMRNSCKTVETYAFLDPGSSVSFCSEQLMEQLGCEGKQMKITLETMGKPHSMLTNLVCGLEVSDYTGGTFIELPRAYSKDRMPVSKDHIPNQGDFDKWEHLNDVKLPQIKSEIGLLIGNNVPDAYTPQIVKTGPRGSPHATKTLLGWVAWNVLRSTAENKDDRFPVFRTEVAALEEVESMRNLERVVKQAINFDFPEKMIDDKKENSQEDKLFKTKIENSIGYRNGHFSINLPFRKDNVKLPQNQTQAFRRLQSLKEKLKRNKKFHEDYTEFMNNILQKGYAEKVPEDRMKKENGKEWYIPHHGIYHSRKPDKIRVVFDCSATYHGISLNSQLLSGPDLTSKLIGVLLRFREENIAIMGDIESMFYQVQVPEEDRDYLRFLWWEDGDVQQEPTVYRMTVHLFGAVSSPSCSNAALHKTAEVNQEFFEEEVIEMIKKNFYVDDCLKSACSEERAITLVQQITLLCQKGGFRLTKWMSNSHTVLDSIPQEERAKGVKHLDLESSELPPERALGVFWEVEKDTLGFKVNLRNHTDTKRGILATVSSVYDQIGMLSPFILTAKSLLQILCRLNVGWDDRIEGDVLRKWTQWKEDLLHIENLHVTRSYKPKDFGAVSTCELHVFSDASKIGYGVVAYLRLTNGKGEIHCSLVFAKSRVAPLKKVTVPRMELTAATLGVRLSKMIVKELEYSISSVFYWTDSMPVIRYIANEKTRFHTFVANRIEVIREASHLKQWNYIETSMNPADIASRGARIQKFLQANFWLQGPDFLWCHQEEWKKEAILDYHLPEADPEVKKVVSSTSVQQTEMIDRLLLHYSDWWKLKKAVAWILMVFDTLKARILKKEIPKVKTRLITSEILDRAEASIIKHVQRQHFTEEMKKVYQQKNATSTRLRKLDPVVIAGILRVGGRLSQAEIPFDAKHPIILPKESNVSTLIIKDVHSHVGHLGKNIMLAILRQKYWILHASTLIKSLVSKCVVCRRYQAKVIEQKMSDLPMDRVTPGEPPFSRVGMDFFGPIVVKRGRGTIKRYGVVFTCLAIRAVHLEVACSLDTDSCINAVRRFIARRGPVKSIRSDNGTNLVGCERELREEIENWNQARINNQLLQKNVSWIFNPPAGSHHGGVWERIIRTVRKVLYSILHQQVIRLDDECLVTVFCEVEAIINGRPITALPNDPNDLAPLTPNHLLLNKGGEKTPPGVFNKADCYVKRRWRQVQYLADTFWKRWIHEYLPQLQERQRWLYPQKKVQVGDNVLVVDNSPRNSWSLARIIELFPDRKGMIRVVKVKTESTELLRPINKLCLVLESDT